jgi:endonuclease YncB( thermonuclease family)
VCVLLMALVLFGPTVPVVLAAPVMEPRSGVPRVVDGDTLELQEVKIRLFGVDAPESKQECTRGGKSYACGKEAAEALRDWLGRRSVRCESRGRPDPYGRMVGVCTVGKGEDVNRWLVEQGWAVAYRQYSKDYVPVEENARSGKRGIWAGEFQDPAQWRREQRGGSGAGPEEKGLLMRLFEWGVRWLVGK